MNNDGNGAQISATTFTNFYVEHLSLTIYLERWDGTSWRTISFTLTNSQSQMHILQTFCQ